MNTGMPGSQRLAVLVLVLLAVAAFALGRGLMASGQEPEIARERTLRFAPEMRDADRAWVRAAIASARPEARRLIDEVDGAVEVSPQQRGLDAIGMAHLSEDRALITLDTAALNADRALDRNVVVLHELGHVIDYMLVPDALVERLDAGIPRDPCRSTVDHIGACTAVEERFADTFAKWALGGAVSMAGSGYGIPTPASIEDWGAPLGELAARLTVESRD
jgi:hypothetical protein